MFDERHGHDLGRHGLAARVRAETIHVRAKRFDDRLILEVADDGIGLGPDGAVREGVGLGNARAPLIVTTLLASRMMVLVPVVMMVTAQVPS